MPRPVMRSAHWSRLCNILRSGMAEIDLADIRQRIDSLDAPIQSLIAERAGLAQAVRAAKGEAASPAEYYRPARAAQVPRNVPARNAGPLAEPGTARLVPRIM